MYRHDAYRSCVAGAVLALAALVVFGGCHSREQSTGVEATGRENIDVPGQQEVAGTGVVRSVAVEGGCWRLATDDGDYELLNLEEDFPSFTEDGLEVRFEGTIRVDAFTTCMVGTNLELTELERR